MSQGILLITPDDINDELEKVIRPSLSNILNEKKPGHCMRCSDLDSNLMVRLCTQLRTEFPTINIYILHDEKSNGIPEALAISSSKLVELRNPDKDNNLRPPLLVFLPAGVKTSAEDSFGVATFEEISLTKIYDQLKEHLLDSAPSSLKTLIKSILITLEDPAVSWKYADALATSRFLITLKKNDWDPEVVGASLFEMCLVPDFELLKDPHLLTTRLKKNVECVKILTNSNSGKTERGRVLEIQLADSTFRNTLANFVTKTGLEDPYVWCRQIISNKPCWIFSFHQWKFKEPIEKGTICIYDVQTSLPKGSDIPHHPHTELLGGEQILPLGPNGIPKFSVSFKVDPHPNKVIGLKKFIAEVISKDEGRTGYNRKKSTWSDSKLQKNFTFDRLNKVTLNEGWHYIRILAYTEDDELIPLVDERDQNIPWDVPELTPDQHLPNISDVFYVFPDGDAPEEPPQRAVQLYPSLMHAKWELFFSAVQHGKEIRENPPNVEWAERKANIRVSEPNLLAIRFPPFQKIHVPVYPHLKQFEQRILDSPKGPVSWKLKILPSKIGALEQDHATFPLYDNTPSFLLAREAYFEALRSEDKELVSQGIDFNKVKNESTEYATTYLQLLQEISHAIDSEQISLQQGIRDLKCLLSCDCITVTIRDNVGNDRKAILVSPTHPLRALWFTVWGLLGCHWLKESQNGQKEHAWETYNSLIKSFSNIHFPTVIPSDESGLMIVIDNLNAFWSVYGSSEESDPRGLFSMICTSLGLPDPGFSGSLIDGEYVSSRIERYLLQHPYITTLTLNVFNPGRASLISDALLCLQSKKEFADLRYDIRLFSQNPEIIDTGESLFELLSPSSSVTKKEAEDFAKPTETHLRPKLALAVKNLDEYLEDPHKHSAHISIVIDLFPAEKVGAIKPSSREVLSPVHGLLQDFRTHYDREAILWKRYPRHGTPNPIPDNEEYVQILSMLSRSISNAASLVVTGKPGISLLPLVSLTLDEKRRALLHQMHESSDWVISIDRNMGIEFFDHGIQDNRPDYLIDHSPDITSYFGHRLFITSRSIDEIEAMVSPILNKYGLPSDQNYILTILNQLRFLSGRLALKLVSSPNQQAEALGLALSRLYLEYQGVFKDQIVIPLDAHLDLFKNKNPEEIDIETEVSFKRTDLALFDLNPKTRTITCRLVEVKCYSSVGDFSAYNSLKDHIREQLDQSERILSSHFKIITNGTDRPDRILKTKELVVLLEFYLCRAERYGIISIEAAEEARLMLEILETGYKMEFTKSAIIFDFEKNGTEKPEKDNEIEYHRIGIDLIRILVEQGSKINSITNLSKTVEKTKTPKTGESDYIVPIIPKHPSLPELKDAAFISPVRVRTVDWDQLSNESLEDTKPLKRIQSKDTKSNKKSDSGSEIKNTTKEKELDSTKIIERKVEPADIEVKKRPIIEECKITVPSVQQSEKQKEIPSNTQEKIPEMINFDVLLGINQSSSPQYGIIGEISGRKIALDLNQTNTISLFGVQGGGKSYTLGSIVEMATMAIPNINILPQPLATIIFHYSSTMDYAPEFTSMIEPNNDSNQIQQLRDRYGACPKQLSDVILLVPKGKLHERSKEFPGIVTLPLCFSASEIKARDWRFLMGAVGSQAMYIRQMNILMKGLRDQLTLDGIRMGVENSSLSDHLKDLARTRLNLAAEYIDDSANLSSLIRPGRLIIVDLRDEFMEKDEALGLFVVLLQLCSDAKFEGKSFNKLVVFDEAHKYIENQDLVSGLIEVVREMRHKGTSILVSQDPPSVPISLIELSSQIILHKFNSPAWLKHIQKANTSLQNLSPEKMSQLQAGEAYIWSSKATDIAFTKEVIKVKLRPRVTKHGGATKTAIDS